MGVIRDLFTKAENVLDDVMCSLTGHETKSQKFKRRRAENAEKYRNRPEAKPAPPKNDVKDILHGNPKYIRIEDFEFYGEWKTLAALLAGGGSINFKLVGDDLYATGSLAGKSTIRKIELTQLSEPYVKTVVNNLAHDVIYQNNRRAEAVGGSDVNDNQFINPLNGE